MIYKLTKKESKYDQSLVVYGGCYELNNKFRVCVVQSDDPKIVGHFVIVTEEMLDEMKNLSV